MRRGGAVATALAVALVAACSGDDTSPDAAPTPASSVPTPTDSDTGACDWPMWGYSATRTFATLCASDIDSESVGRLVPAWEHLTDDVVTATPAVADGTAFVGDWSGRFTAISLDDGEVRWTFDAPPHAQVYSGQIVASAATALVDGELLVLFASGKTMYALRADDGSEVWHHELNPQGDESDPTEIQSSPVVVGDLVVFGFDGHDTPGVRAGVMALDIASGDEVWYFDPDAPGEASGCVGVWSSPAVDVERELVFVGSANCPTSPQGWSDYSEAIYAISLVDGTPQWSFQPRGPSNLDFDFAGAPNLFDADGRDLVGLGGKDGIYYALERATGALVWQTVAAQSRVQSPNFSTGGFIGATAVAGGVVVGGTAIDSGCPCLHGLDATTGDIAWQTNAAGATFAPTSIVNDVAFSGSTTDFTLRAVSLATGDVLWSHQMLGGVAGGAVVTDDLVIAVAGIREPGVDPAGTQTGVFAFRLGDPSEITTTTAGTAVTLPPTTEAPPPEAVDPSLPEQPRCVASPCTLGFTLKEPPPGTAPEMSVWLTPSPFRIEVRSEGLGEPSGWLRPDSPSAEQGAVAYGVFVSDDSLNGALLCVLDGSGDCVNDVAPADAGGLWNRISVLAIADTPVLPSPADGFDRLVTTEALDEPVTFE